MLNGVRACSSPEAPVRWISDVFGTESPKAQLYFEGGFVGGIATGQVNPKLKAGKTIGDFPWPTIKASLDHPVVENADFATAFKDNADVRAFLKYISIRAAGRIWDLDRCHLLTRKVRPSAPIPSPLVRAEVKQLATGVPL